MALFIWMTNISRKRFGPQVENTKQNDVIENGNIFRITGPRPTKDKSHDILQISWH